MWLHYAGRIHQLHSPGTSGTGQHTRITTGWISQSKGRKHKDLTALFTIARKWKQPRCPSTDKWINKLWCIHIMEYYSAIKRNTFESVLMRWTKLEPIIQSEVSQKYKYHILTHIYGIWRDGTDEFIFRVAVGLHCHLLAVETTLQIACAMIQSGIKALHFVAVRLRPSGKWESGRG